MAIDHVHRHTSSLGVNSSTYIHLLIITISIALIKRALVTGCSTSTIDAEHGSEHGWRANSIHHPKHPLLEPRNPTYSPPYNNSNHFMFAAFLLTISIIVKYSTTRARAVHGFLDSATRECQPLLSGMTQSTSLRLARDHGDSIVWLAHSSMTRFTQYTSNILAVQGYSRLAATHAFVNVSISPCLNRRNRMIGPWTCYIINETPNATGPNGL